MNQTLQNLSDLFDSIKDDKKVIQSLLKRVNILETTPDAEKEMLAEYARNFDTLAEAVNEIIMRIQGYSQSEDAVLASIKETVENYHWQIDENTLRGLENLVTKRTGFNLPNYISAIQKQLFEKEFKRLDTQLKTVVKPIFDDIESLADQQKRQEKRIDSLTDTVQYLVFVVLALAVASIFGFFGQIIWAFDKHPIISSILLVVGLIGVGIIAYVMLKEEKRNEAEAKREEEEREREARREEGYDY